MNFLVRSQGDPSSLTVAVQRALQSLDARGVVFNVRPFEDFVGDSVTPRRFNLWLLGAFAVLAVVLALAGIYGTMSYAVAQRTREVGIRVALGAQGGDVLKLVVGEGMKLIVVGIGVGLLGAFLLTRWMKSLLFAVSASDPLTFVVITLLLMIVALFACWLPARRATKVDPLVALRYE
jgi:ABC-type antimicrobial peptide transport system permease subunit